MRSRKPDANNWIARSVTGRPSPWLSRKCFRTPEETNMSMLRLKSLWRRLVHRTRLDQSLDAEVRAYLEHDIDNRIAEGMSPADARRAALVELGSPDQVKES